MIDNGTLTIPPSEKKPSNKNNPLFSHAIFKEDQEWIDCSHLIFDSVPEINGISHDNEPYLIYDSGVNGLWYSDDEDDWAGEQTMIARVDPIHTGNAIPYDYGKQTSPKKVEITTTATPSTTPTIVKDEAPPQIMLPKQDQSGDISFYDLFVDSDQHRDRKSVV